MGKSSPKEDWRPLATKNPRLRGKFLCGYLDEKKFNFRRCIACNLDIGGKTESRHPYCVMLIPVLDQVPLWKKINHC